MAKRRFFFDKKGNKIAVVIGIKEYERMLEDLEELDDIRAYDAAKQSGETPIPFEQIIKNMKRSGR
jgi:hypothetical protein